MISCKTQSDTERHMEIGNLPPVLHFSLLRFVYDLSTMERRKSKHNISYPTIIDMDRFLGPPGSIARRRRKKGDMQGKNMYQLRGILLHRGASAYHGHYEAQVFDVQYVQLSHTLCKSDCVEGLSRGTSSTTKRLPRLTPFAGRSAAARRTLRTSRRCLTFNLHSRDADALLQKNLL